MTKLSLPGVTLVAVDSACLDLTKKALEDCLSKADFGEVLYLTPKDLKISGAQWHVYSGTQSEDAERAIWFTLPFLVKTDHFLLVQWDSWIVDPTIWNDLFLNYDYIGAPWRFKTGAPLWYNQRNVGNGGFSLRSTRLMRRVGDHSFKFYHPEDHALCRGYRLVLNQEGFKWPSAGIASRFAFERTDLRVVGKAFGFHGMFNWPLFLNQEQIDERMALATPYVLESKHCKEMQETIRNATQPKLARSLQ